MAGERFTTNPGLARLASLFHRRWAAPVLAELWRETQRRGGSTFVTLVHRVETGEGRRGAPAGSVRAALDHLVDLGLVARHTGYGHPLRPEYILTAPGIAMAEGCARLESRACGFGVWGIARKKWSMPVLCAIDERPRRFGEVARELGGLITPRALAGALKDLTNASLLWRVVEEGYPPRALYAPTERGLTLTPLVRALG